MKKTQVALNLVNSIEVQAVQAARKVKNACNNARAELERRQLQGEDPDTEKLPTHYSNIAAAAAEFNTTQISIPSKQDVLDLIDGSESAKE